MTHFGRPLFYILVIGILLLLAGCTNQDKPKPQPTVTGINFSNLVPSVPADIQARGNQRTKPPVAVNGQISQSEIQAMTARFIHSEEEKIAFINRLMRIINSTREQLRKPIDLRELQSQLAKAQGQK